LNGEEIEVCLFVAGAAAGTAPWSSRERGNRLCRARRGRPLGGSER